MPQEKKLKIIIDICPIHPSMPQQTIDLDYADGFFY